MNGSGSKTPASNGARPFAVTLLDIPEDRRENLVRLFASVNVVVGPHDRADCAVILSDAASRLETPAHDLPVVLLLDGGEDLDQIDRLLASGVDGILTMPLRRRDVTAQMLLARQHRRLKQIQQRKIERLESSLRNRRQIERAVEIIVARDNINRLQAFEHLRRAAMDQRLPIWTFAERLTTSTPDSGDNTAGMS